MAIVTAGVPLIQIHKADMKHKITYFGTKVSISELQLKLSKDKESVHKCDLNNSGANEDVEDGKFSEESSEDSDGNNVSKSEEINDESSTSPFKSAGCSQVSVLNDSGIGSPESKAVSSKKACLSFDIE